MSEQWIFGWHAVFSLLKNPNRQVNKLIINKDKADKRLAELLERAKQLGISTEFVSLSTIDQRFPHEVHQGIVAQANPLPSFSEYDLPHLLEKSRTPPLILILDGVTDPHNLGACLRTADAAGVDFVIIPRDKSASITAVVSKVACGAAETIPLVKVTNLVRAIEILKEEAVWIYGADGEASEAIYQMDFSGPIALVMGAEGHGLRRLTKEHCDGLFSLPMQGCVESLNVSVATGVSLYEVVRQRYK